LKRSRKIIGGTTFKNFPEVLEKKLRDREKVEIYYVIIFSDKKIGKIIPKIGKKWHFEDFYI
jgi:hypothetical protein